MTLRTIILFSLLPLSLQLSNDKIVSEALDGIIEMMETLVDEYNYQDSQMNKMHATLTVLEYGYNSLRHQLSGAECSVSELLTQSRTATLAIDDQTQQIERLVENITACVEDANSTLETINDILHPCGAGDWELVVNEDYSSRGGDACPGNWTEVMMESGRRFCGGQSAGPSDVCDSALFNVNRVYRKVCGIIVGYGSGINDGFGIATNASIEDIYVDGLSLTHGEENSREHIWTFAIGAVEDTSTAAIFPFLCPCHPNFALPANDVFPDFVANDYFCESGTTSLLPPLEPHLDDTLWDGRECFEDCCNSSPYFVKALNLPTSDPLELRLCNHGGGGRQNNLVEMIQIYVQQD